MTFSNTDNIIDVRDIIARVEELRELRQPGPVDLGNEIDNETDQDTLFEELATLEKLLDSLKGNGGDEQWEGDWYPITLIDELYFETYARELAEDCGMINSDATWPNNCIDWEKAARELQWDYTSVDYDGRTFWHR